MNFTLSLQSEQHLGCRILSAGRIHVHSHSTRRDEKLLFIVHAISDEEFACVAGLRQAVDFQCYQASDTATSLFRGEVIPPDVLL